MSAFKSASTEVGSKIEISRVCKRSMSYIDIASVIRLTGEKDYKKTIKKIVEKKTQN